LEDCYFAIQAGCRYDSTSTAAWVQAVGSVVAIAVSAALAFIIPARERTRQAEEEIARAIRMSVVSLTLVTSGWESYRKLARAGRWHQSSHVGMMEHVRTCRDAIAAIDYRLLPDDFAIWLSRARLSLAALEAVIALATEARLQKRAPQLWGADEQIKSVREALVKAVSKGQALGLNFVSEPPPTIIE
jgi:hypothetical protein